MSKLIQINGTHEFLIKKGIDSDDSINAFREIAPKSIYPQYKIVSENETFYIEHKFGEYWFFRKPDFINYLINSLDKAYFKEDSYDGISQVHSDIDSNLVSESGYLDTVYEQKKFELLYHILTIFKNNYYDKRCECCNK